MLSFATERVDSPSRPGPEQASGRSHEPRQGERVVAVVVTFNREHLVGECLDALADQTRPLDAIVVVDNASTDRSGAIADSHRAQAEVIHLHRNVGGAGGFSAGMAHALTHLDPDYLWLMDDDTIARPDALEQLLAARDRLNVHASVLSSQALWTNGEPHPMNSSRTRLGTRRDKVEMYQRAGVRPIRSASFVSALIDAHDARAHGLPHADYFIWSDDFEFTGRLAKTGHAFAVPGSIVEHRTATFYSAQSNPGARFYYDVRNKLWALTKSPAFTPSEKALYGGKSVLGWARTVVRTRGDVLPTAAKAVRDAVVTSPRPNAQVLSADPEMAQSLRLLDAECSSRIASNTPAGQARGLLAAARRKVSRD